MCGDKESANSLRSLNAELRILSIPNIESRFLIKDIFPALEEQSLDDTLIQYAKKINSYQGAILLLLHGPIGEGFVGVGELFDQGALCLIEADSDLKHSPLAHALLSTGKAHLELRISDMGEFI